MKNYSRTFASSPSPSLPKICFILTAILLFFFTTYLCPPMSDDYWHGYLAKSENGQLFFSTTPIDLSNFFQGCRNYIDIHNSRLCSFVTILTAAIKSKLLFSLSNLAVVICLVYFISKISIKSLSIGFISSSIALFALFNPSFFGTVIWMSGALSYIWGALVLSCFFHIATPHVLVMSNGQRNRLVAITICFLCCLWHEAIALPLLSTLILWFLLQRNHINKTYILQLTLVSIIAACILVSAPGMWSRVESSSPVSFSYFCSAVLMMGFKCFFPLIAFFILCWKARKNLLNDFFAIFAIMNFFFALACGVQGAWGGGYFYFCFSTFIWLLRIIKNVYFERKIWITISGIIVLMSMSYACICSFEMNKVMKHVVAQAHQSRIVSLDYKPMNAGLYFGLRRCLALPYDQNYYFTHAGKYHGLPNFFTVWNDCVTDTSPYTNFNTSSKEICIQKSAAGHIIIQLPKDWFCDQLNSPTLHNKSTQISTKTRANEYWNPMILDFLYKYFPKIYRAPIGMDVYNGRAYVILPAPTERFSKITMGLFNIHTMEYKYETVDLPTANTL